MATHSIPAFQEAAAKMKLLAAHDDAKQMLQNHPDNLLPHLAAKFFHLLVAVLRHNVKELGNDVAPKDKYLVFRAKRKTTIEQIRDIYAENNDLQASDVVLQHPNGIVITVVKASELEMYGDRIVAIEAVKADRQASQTGSISASSGDFARQPLQEVKRQLTVPPQQSADDVARAKSATPHDSLYGGRPWVNKDASNYSASPLAQPPAATRAGASMFSGLEGWSPAQTVTPKQEPLDEAEAQSAQAGGAEMELKREDSPKYEPEMSENPFTMPIEDGPDLSTRGTPLRELAQITEPERLEASVKKGVTFLAALCAPLKQMHNNPDAVAFLEQIETVRNEAVRSRTVVGVVGNTGAGKSSVINAMLEEERLVPTNCMRACTAVVTEMSYNHSKAESQKYRAEIEFITQADWHKELTVLYEEVFDEAGRLNQDARNPDSEAGIAYAKMRAVYPKHTNEMLGKSSVDRLMREPTVGKVLGTTRKINERVPDAFYQKLQNYVDSKEKTEPKLDKNGHKIGNRKRKFEYWPLIKVVRIFTKADALSTGAVIVDLPGVHDSNAARAAVAAGYLKQCSGLWIVAPVTRAVDDKAAQKLLGDTFRRQLKFDGAYSAVTFICSKTDDISRTEAAESLRSQLGEQIAAIDERTSAIKRECREIKQKRTELKNQKSDHDDVFNDVDEKIDAWEALKDRADDGEVVYPPREKVPAKKRKRGPTTPSARKKRRGRGGDASDVEYISSDDEGATEAEDDGCEAPAADRQPLTSEQIDEKLDELKKLKKDARKAKGTIEEEIRTLNKRLAKLEDEEADLEDQDQQLCIEGRNEYSRTAIRQDFAAGIKDLDMENAEEEDPENFNPHEDIRDYDELARSLPVFCVSSRAYQKLCGRLKKDKDVPGFSKPEQTEMPQLQVHCKKLTENGRAATCRRFLNSLARLVSSLALWASDDGSGPKLSAQQHDFEQKYLRRRLDELEKVLTKTVNSTFADAKETMTDFIYDLFPPTVLAAVSTAAATQAKWGAHRNDGGLHFMTYKATTRRSGVWQGRAGLRDFNDELTAPVLKHLQNNWERTFVRKLPHVLQAFAKSGSKVLRDFHKAIEDRCREKGHGVARIGMLGHQLRNYENMFNDASQATIKHVQDQQRDINREFVPVIQDAMQPAYDICAGESGTGSFRRMKAAMESFVNNNKDQMFKKACADVQDQLDNMCATAKDIMLSQTSAIFLSMKRDYMSLVGVDANQIQQVPHGVRQAKLEIDDIVSLMDEEFRKVLEAELTALEPEEEPGEAEHEEDEGIEEDDEIEEDEEDEDDEDEDAFEGVEKSEQDGDAMDADGVDAIPIGEGAAEPEQTLHTPAAEDDEEFHSFV